MKPILIVTRDSLKTLIEQSPLEKQVRIVGRALVVLYNRQTETERSHNSTDASNMSGFSGPDAFAGSLSAKSFMKHRTLQSWQLEQWTRLDRRGYPRICKYHRQLNQAAVEKMQSKGGDDAQL